MNNRRQDITAPTESPSGYASRSLWAKLSQPFRNWFVARLPSSDQTTLHQRNVYILPTGPGWMLAITLLVLLVASINYQLSLGYLLTFLLAGACVIGVYRSHANLRGLTLCLMPPADQFAGKRIPLQIQILNLGDRPRYGIGLFTPGHPESAWTDVPPHSETTVQVHTPAKPRGRHLLAPVLAQTRFPLGTFRVWTVWRIASHIVIYPAPEAGAPALPRSRTIRSSAVLRASAPDEDLEDLRTYRRGDSPRRILWKKAAKSNELFSRDTAHSDQDDLWLDIDTAVAGLPAGVSHTTREHALSRMCAWVLMAESRGLRYGLRLERQVIHPGTGGLHQRECLHALAMDGFAQHTDPRRPANTTAENAHAAQHTRSRL